MKQNSNRFLAILALIATLGIAGLATAAILMPHGIAPGSSDVGGSFKLTSQDGATVTQTALQGQPTLVFFGYTHCPDVCPTTLAQISALFRELGPDEKARALFVTVDPQRDTPAVLKDYLTSFDPRITALTGTPDEVKGIERAYKVYAKAVPDKDGTYTMDHTAMVYMMDKQGRFVGAFNLEQPVKDAAAELKTYF